MIALGELALWIALPIAIFGAVLSFLGHARRRGDMVLSGERAVLVVTGLLAFASAGIIAAFLTDRFDYWYVYTHSNRALGTYFKVAGLWSGQTGSLVFWALLVGVFSSVAVLTNRNRNREFMPGVTGVLLSVLSFWLILALFVTNPFQLTSDFIPFAVVDGNGLNPQLQSYWMTIHPPMLYLGLTSFTVPFAFGMSALISGRLDSRWIRLTRKWILLSWFFLSIGIVLGMRWAYEELGWGGYWFWDPVENSSLIPWILATAFLHSIQIQENRGMLKIWNMALLVATYIATVFSTFMTRSGLIDSVHSFAENLTIAYWFLGFMGLLAVVGTTLIVWRAPQLRSERQIESFLSRESAFLFNNLVLLAAAFAVLWGTLFPLISEGFLGREITVGPEFFNRVNIPIGLVLLGLAGIGPVIAWRRASARNLKKNFLLPVGVGLVVLGVLYAAGTRGWAPLFTFGVGSFVLAVIFREFWKGTQARARIEGEGYGVALVHLVSRNRRRWGGYVVHGGIVAMFMGFAGSSFDVEVRDAMEPGDVTLVTSPLGHTYELAYQGLSYSVTGEPGASPVSEDWTATFQVSKAGRRLGTLSPRKRLYPIPGRVDPSAPPFDQSSEVRIRSTFLEDLYVVLEDAEAFGFSGTPPNQRITAKVLVNPLVGWVWFGALLLAVGAVVGLWPGGVVRDAESSGEPQRTSSPSSAATG